MREKEIAVELVATKILVVRGKKAMLDRDLAELYGVKTKVLLQSVKRNTKRFPGDFMYQLTEQEVVNLRSQDGVVEDIYRMFLLNKVLPCSQLYLILNGRFKLTLL